MGKIVFRLNGVEDDEANDVRALLEEAEIEFYETHAGRWRISVAAIWLKNPAEFEQARALIDEYQQQRSEQIRQQPVQSFWQRSKEQPVELFFTLLAVVLVCALMLLPFAAWLGFN